VCIPRAKRLHSAGRRSNEAGNDTPGQLIPTAYKNNIFLSLKRLSSTTGRGSGAVEFLIGHFNLLGFEGQNWMLIVAGLIAAFILFVVTTRDRT
jgi:hypothetical protein